MVVGRATEDRAPALDAVARALLAGGLSDAAVERACFAETVGGACLVDALLATGEVPPVAFAAAVRAVHGLPAVGPEALARAPAEGAAWLPVALAGAAGAVALARGEHLRVAISDPSRLEALEALRQAVDRPMDLVYGPPGAVREAFGRVYHVVWPETFYREPGRRRLDPGGFPTGAGVPGVPRDAVASAAFLEGRLWEARSSRQVIEAVLTFLAGCYDAAAFFLVEGELVAGREAMGDPDLKRVVLPRRGPTLFSRVLDARRPFAGPPPAHLADAVVHRRVSRPPPRQVLYVPLCFDATPVGLLYADAVRDDARLPPGMDPARLGTLTVSALQDLFARHLQAVFDLAAEGDRRRRPAGVPADPGDPVAHVATVAGHDRGAVAEVVRLGAAAIPALVEAFPGRLRPEVDADPDAREDVARHSELLAAVSAMGSAGVAVALAALSDPDPVRRRFGALLFTRLPAREGLPALVALLADDAPGVADAAVRALSRQGRTAEGPALARRLVEGLAAEGVDDAPHRRRLLRVLGALGQPATVPAILGTLADPEVAADAEAALEALLGPPPPGRDRVRAWRRHWRKART